MSDPEGGLRRMPADDEDGPEARGVNLVLVYSLLGLGLLAAILFACFIVWPFWIRR
jgi:hypothetical protein